VHRDRDVVIRMGGDEFLIILHDVEPLDAVDLARRIVARVEDPIEFQGQGLEVSASIGVAMVQRGGEGDTEALLHRADAAMYAAKRSESAVELAQP
jgi:diguanylate cyclase (GGDEF)-like protein